MEKPTGGFTDFFKSLTKDKEESLLFNECKLLPDFTREYRLENGVSFFHQYTEPIRLYVKRHREEIDAELPDADLTGMVIDVNKNTVFLFLKDKFYSAVFVPPRKIRIYVLRSIREGEQVHRVLVSPRILCSCTKLSETYYYNLWEDTDDDGVGVKCVVPARKREDLKFLGCHRGKLILYGENTTFTKLVQLDKDTLAIKFLAGDHFSAFFRESSPLLYILRYRRVNPDVITINTDTLEMLPVMHTELKISEDIKYQITSVIGDVMHVDECHYNGIVLYSRTALRVNLPNRHTRIRKKHDSNSQGHEPDLHVQENEKNSDSQEHEAHVWHTSNLEDCEDDVPEMSDLEDCEDDVLEMSDLEDCEDDVLEMSDLEDCVNDVLDFSMKEALPIEKCTDTSDRNEKVQSAEDSYYESEFLKRFQPRRILGYGGYGQVFEAERTIVGDIKRNFAIKRIPIRESFSRRKKDKTSKALKEVEALLSFDHPGIVRFYDAWKEDPPEGWQKWCDDNILQYLKTEHDPLPREFEPFNYRSDCSFLYIQMELCQYSLSDWLSRNTLREMARAKHWFKQIVVAVEYIHEQNKIHRDLKSSNILFAGEDRLKICDLGIVADRAIKNGREFPGTRSMNKGTGMYMAPEQRGFHYTSKVDIFALGLILAEMVVVIPIDEAEEVFEMYQNGERPDILQHLPRVENFVAWLTSMDPDERPDCSDILRHSFFSEVPPQPPPRLTSLSPPQP